jgi:excisionase family DNA binding protein
LTDLFTTREVAAICRVSTKTVRRSVSEGKLRMIRQGRFKFRRETVEYLLGYRESSHEKNKKVG